MFVNYYSNITQHHPTTGRCFVRGSPQTNPLITLVGCQLCVTVTTGKDDLIDEDIFQIGWFNHQLCSVHGEFSTDFSSFFYFYTGYSLPFLGSSSYIRSEQCPEHEIKGNQWFAPILLVPFFEYMPFGEFLSPNLNSNTVGSSRTRMYLKKAMERFGEVEAKETERIH